MLRKTCGLLTILSLWLTACHEETGKRRQSPTAAAQNATPNEQNPNTSTSTGTNSGVDNSSTNTGEAVSGLDEETFLQRLPIITALAKALIQQKLTNSSMRNAALAGIDFIDSHARAVVKGEDQEGVATSLISVLTQNGISLDQTKQANVRDGVAKAYQAIQAARQSGQLNIGQMASMLSSVVNATQAQGVQDPVLQLLMDPTVLNLLASQLGSGAAGGDISQLSQLLENLAASKK